MKQPRLLPALAMALCTACGEVPAPDADPDDGRPLVIAIQADFSGVNELLSSSQVDHEIRSQLFLHLFREVPDYQEHPPTLEPQLATGCDFSEDRLLLTCRLREGVTWSDGEPVTAHDVVWTWQAQTDPAVGWIFGYVKESIEDVRAVDDHTVEFRFLRSYPTQLLDVNEGFVLPRHAWRELPFAEWRGNADWFRERLVVSGPYALARWTPGQEIVLAANPRYYRPGLPRVGEVSFRVLPDRSTRLAQLLAGEVDAMDDVPPARGAEVAARDDVALHTLWSRQYAYVVWNTERPWFDSSEARRAMTLAIDREALVEALWAGYGRVAVSPILSSVWAHNRDLEPIPYDPARATEILAELGWRDGDGDGVLDRDGVPFRFELSATAGSQLSRDAVVLIQEQLGRIGVAAEPRFLEPQTLFASNESHDFDATLGAWAIDTTLDVRYAFATSEIDGGANYGSYSSPRADVLMEEIVGTFDPADAKPLFDELQEILHRDQPYTFLWEPQMLVGIRERVVDARPTPLLTYYYLEEWGLSAGEGSRPAPAP